MRGQRACGHEAHHTHTTARGLAVQQCRAQTTSVVSADCFLCCSCCQMGLKQGPTLCLLLHFFPMQSQFLPSFLPYLIITTSTRLALHRNWDPSIGLVCVHALRIGDSCGNIRCLLALKGMVYLGCQVCASVFKSFTGDLSLFLIKAFACLPNGLRAFMASTAKIRQQKHSQDRICPACTNTHT